MIKFSCPHCNRKISADDKYAGVPSKCPSCDGQLTVPTMVTSTAPMAPNPPPPPATSVLPSTYPEKRSSSGDPHRSDTSKSEQRRNRIVTLACVVVVAALMVGVFAVSKRTGSHGRRVAVARQAPPAVAVDGKTSKPAITANPKEIPEAKAFAEAASLTERGLMFNALTQALRSGSGLHAPEFREALKDVWDIDYQLSELKKPPVKPVYEKPEYSGTLPLSGQYRGTYNGDKGIVVQAQGVYYVVLGAVPPNVPGVTGYIEDTGVTTTLDIGRDGRTAKIVALSNRETYQDDQKEYRESVATAKAEFEEAMKKYESVSDPNVRERTLTELNAKRVQALDEAARKVGRILGITVPNSFRNADSTINNPAGAQVGRALSVAEPGVKPVPAQEPNSEPAQSPPPIPAVPSTGPATDRIVKAMQASIRSGKISEFSYEQVINWKVGSEERTGGEIYQTGFVDYKADSLFGEKTVRAKALLKNGVVVKWLWADNGNEIK